MEAITKTEVKSPLKDKKVRIVPIERDGGWLPKGHDGYFLYTGAKISYCVPRTENGKLVDPLTRDERDWFESAESGMAFNKGDLSIHKSKENYWEKFYISIDKNGLLLDLSDPIDYFKLAVLKTNTSDIAPSYKDRFNKGSYKFAIVEESEDLEMSVNKATLSRQAWTLFGKMEDSPTKMAAFLYRHTGNKPAKNSTREFLVAEVTKVIEREMGKFVSTLKDPDYEMQVFVDELIDAGIVKSEGKTKLSVIPLQATFNTRPEFINYLNDSTNQESLIQLKTLLKNSK